MNSDTIKPEKFGHLHLVYHFTVPLTVIELQKGFSYRQYITILKKDIMKRAKTATQMV